MNLKNLFVYSLSILLLTHSFATISASFGGTCQERVRAGCIKPLSLWNTKNNPIRSAKHGLDKPYLKEGINYLIRYARIIKPNTICLGLCAFFDTPYHRKERIRRVVVTLPTNSKVVVNLYPFSQQLLRIGDNVVLGDDKRKSTRKIKKQVIGFREVGEKAEAYHKGGQLPLINYFFNEPLCKLTDSPDRQAKFPSKKGPQRIDPTPKPYNTVKPDKNPPYLLSRFVKELRVRGRRTNPCHFYPLNIHLPHHCCDDYRFIYQWRHTEITVLTCFKYTLLQLNQYERKIPTQLAALLVAYGSLFQQQGRLTLFYFLQKNYWFQFDKPSRKHLGKMPPMNFLTSKKYGDFFSRVVGSTGRRSAYLSIEGGDDTTTFLSFDQGDSFFVLSEERAKELKLAAPKEFLHLWHHPDKQELFFKKKDGGTHKISAYDLLHKYRLAREGKPIYAYIESFPTQPQTKPNALLNRKKSTHKELH